MMIEDGPPEKKWLNLCLCQGQMEKTKHYLRIVGRSLRIAISIALVLTGLVWISYGIWTGKSQFAGPNWLAFLLFLLCLLVLGIMEGVQISLVRSADMLLFDNGRSIEVLYPRSYKLMVLASRGRNLSKFLMGRQVLFSLTL